MYQVTMEEASVTLPALILAAHNGEEIILMENNLAVARLIPASEVLVTPFILKRKAGSALGKGYEYRMAEDFNAPLDDFME